MSIPNVSQGLSLLILLLLSAVCLDVASASPAPKLFYLEPTNPESPPPSLMPREIFPNGTINCETPRSSDYYGIGVRLGVYFAWFQAWVANVCVPSEIHNAQDTNAVFLFAILVAMVKCTTTHLLQQLDGLLLMHMSGGTIFSVLSIWGYRTCVYDIDGPRGGIRKFGGYGTHFRLLLCVAVSSFGMFFWVYGLSGALPQHDDFECSQLYTFMFSKVRADGRIRGFYIFICIACMTYFGSMLLVSLVAAPTRLRRFQYAYQKGNSCERTRLRFATGLNQKQLRYTFYFLRVGNLLFILYSMLLVEYTLNYNNVASVLGWEGHIFFPSQIIPMIIGAFGFCKVIYIRYQQWKSPGPSDPGSLYNSSRSALQRFPWRSKEVIKMYTPKSNLSMEFAVGRNDQEMDPLLARGQPLWLRLLVAWLPWLGVLRWWTHDDDANTHSLQAQDDTLSGAPSNANSHHEHRDSSDNETYSVRWSVDTTPRTGGESDGGHRHHRDTWNSDLTVVSSRQRSPVRNLRGPSRGVETPHRLHHPETV